MNKKFELTGRTALSPSGETLYRIRALVDIPHFRVKSGDLGGFVEKESNLSQEGNAWIKSDAKVWGDSRIYGDVIIELGALIKNSTILGEVEVFGAVKITDCHINGTYFRIQDRAELIDCELRGEEVLFNGKAFMKGGFCKHDLNQFLMSGEARLENPDNLETNLGGTRITITDKARLYGVWNLLGEDITIKNQVVVEEKTTIHGNRIYLTDFATIKERVSIYDDTRVAECATLMLSQSALASVRQARFDGDVEVDIGELLT